MGIGFTSCDDFLDKNRYQPTNIENTQEYWDNYDNCVLQVTRYIASINNGYSTGGSTDCQFLFSTRSDDQVGSGFVNWSYTSVPSTSDWSYSQVRGANFIINMAGASEKLTSPQKANIVGIARLIRADAYFSLVRNYGNCVWENQVMDPSDKEALLQAPIDRDIIMDSVFADLDFAIATIQTDKARLSWSKDLARCLKSEAALYEGTFCKYRVAAENGKGPDANRSKKYLEECAKVSKELIGKYGFAEGIDGYMSIYQSVYGGGSNGGVKYSDFASQPEIIFGRRYDQTNLKHSVISYTCSSTTTSGMSLDAFKAYLFLDGKPAASTNYDTSLEGVNGVFNYKGEDIPNYSIRKVVERRDLRLGVATDTIVYFKGMEGYRAGATGMNASAGLGVRKYDNIAMPLAARNNSAQNYTSAPIYWTSYIMCNYIEAVAELGTITDADLDLTYNKMMTRAGLPTQTVASLSAINDPANNMDVSSLIWEIRRNRRCELMFDGFRFKDLVRWHQLELLDSKNHPDILRGAYVANIDPDHKPADVDAEGYIRPYPDNQREYNYKYYLLPHSSGQIELYRSAGKELPQNPGWE